MQAVCGDLFNWNAKHLVNPEIISLAQTLSFNGCLLNWFHYKCVLVITYNPESMSQNDSVYVECLACAANWAEYHGQALYG